ncbi:MAG: efflux RND transporter periplasmic adaptor subunit [Desulfomicrobium apsheronum]|nr:efflux RND transporter periplasmic adaptor subunit [Desulfomicrobium apsheronum]
MNATLRKYAVWVTAGCLLVVLGLGGGYLLWAPPGSGHDGHDHAGQETSEGAPAASLWTCSMHPQIKLPEPGQCPICFMDLIPLAIPDGEDRRTSLRQLSLSPDAARLAGIRVEAARLAEVSVQTHLFGKVAYDESRVGVITAWVGGRIDRLHVDTTGAVVRAGQAMALVYSPELVAAQAELIQAVRARERMSGGSRLVADSALRMEHAAREKLRLLGMGKAQIESIVKRGTPADHVTLTAPQLGIVIEKKVVEGMYVQTGMPIYAVADLSRVWVVLEAYESDLVWMAPGKDVAFRVEALPGQEFTGKVVYVGTSVNPATRTVEVRVEVPNPGLALKPGMFVSAMQQDGDAQRPRELVIPASAPLITGKRAVVYVADPDRPGVYEGREVVLGSRTDQGYVVRGGIAEGEQVVVQGNFRIDAALQIVARPSMMNPAEAPAASGVRFAEVPQPFSVRLAALAQRLGAVEEAVAAGGLDAVRGAYHDFGKALNGVDADALDGEAALEWKELSMLLGNDALLGYESPTPRRASQVLDDMRGHFARVRAAFPLEELTAKIEAPAGLRSALDALYAAYVPVQEALAGDDANTAHAALVLFRQALGQADESARVEGSEAWSGHSAAIASGLGEMEQAVDMEGLRAGFYPLSVAMSRMVETYGAGQGPVYELYCPMAFGDQGATWLQGDPRVNNPYFGASMLRCGEVKRQLRGE